MVVALIDASTTGFVVTPNSTNIKQTNARADIALHRYIPLLNGNSPQYQIEACDAGNLCNNSTPVAKASLSNAEPYNEINQLIGYFKASNTNEGDFFGHAVSLSEDGNTLAVGANLTKIVAATVSGAVYVFVRDSSSANWSQQAHIKASNADS